MKLLTLAAATMAAMFAAKSAVAQTPVYDTITNATTAWYTTLSCPSPCVFLGGDNFITNPVPSTGAPVCVCQIDIVFVANAAGVYNVTLTAYDNQCFTGGIGAVTGAVNVGAPGVYVVTFNLNPPFCFTGDPNAGPFFLTPGAGSLSVCTDSDNFVPAFDNSATVNGVDSDGAAFDTNCNNILEACVAPFEWYTFDLTWTNMNMLMILYTNCPPAPALRGPSLGGNELSVRKLDLPVKKAPRRLQMTDFLPKL